MYVIPVIKKYQIHVKCIPGVQNVSGIKKKDITSVGAFNLQLNQCLFVQK